MAASSSSLAWKTFQIENDIVNDDTIYSYDEIAQKEILRQRPWKSNPNYFSAVRISAIALLRMAMHAGSGKNLEVMGVMTGKIIGHEFIVMDAYPLPVEGTETRVNALGEAYEYMVEYLTSLQAVGRQENIVGWYHSHPGYGCWLSGIDVGTQSQNQQFQDPFLAIVVDPNRTISAGKVDIGAFRTYPPEYVLSKGSDSRHGQEIPAAKLEDFGVHANKYYPLKVSYFKSTLDSQVLEVLWNKYWTSTLAQSSLVINHDYTTDQILDLATKTGNLSKNGSNIEIDNGGDSPHRSSLFGDQIHKLQSIFRDRPDISGVVRKNLSGSASSSSSAANPLAIESVAASAVKIGSEEIQGLISREIKKSVLQVSK